MPSDPEWAFKEFVGIDLYTRMDVFSIDFLGGFFQIIARELPTLLPKRIYRGKRIWDRSPEADSPDAVSRELVANLLKTVDVRATSTLELQGGTRGSENLIILSRATPATLFHSISLLVLQDSLGTSTSPRALDRSFEALVQYCDAAYGRISSNKELDHKEYALQYDAMGNRMGRVRPPLLPDNGLYSVFYMNYFGPEYAAFFGREALERVAGLTSVTYMNRTGGFLVRIGDSPTEWSKEENLKLSAEIVRVLDHNAFMDNSDPRKELSTPFERKRFPDTWETTDAVPFKKVSKNQLKELRRVSSLFIRGIEETFGRKLGYDIESLRQLDAIIQEGWDGQPPEKFDEVISSFGTYLGEVLTKTFGGDWVQSENHAELAVQLSGDLLVFPFSKMEKRFRNGMQDSISFYLRVLDKEAREGKRIGQKEKEPGR